MDYEKKYKEALERAEGVIEQNPLMEYLKKGIEYIFPELKESEDERVRKEIMDFIDTKTIDSDERRNRWFSYLEKYKPIPFMLSEDTKVKMSLVQYISELNQDVVHLHPGIETCNEWIAWLEKQGEQKPTLPKWKYKKDNTPLLRDSIILNKYGCVAKSPSGAIVSDVWVINYDELAKLPKEELEKQDEQKPIIDGILTATNYDKMFQNCNVHKFNIGDWILYSGDHYEGVRHITKINENGYYIERNGLPHGIIPFNHEICMRLWTIEDAKDGEVLASKDKEDILIYKSHSVIDLLLTSHISFNKKEGFCPRQYSAWDSNEFIPATKEQRDLLFQKIHEAGCMWDSESKQLLSLKAEPSDEQNPAWSEEDEEFLRRAINAAKDAYPMTAKWLKSLKGRCTWKPSDGQIHAFEQVYDWYNDNFAPSETLTSLYNDLKKLKGE